MLAEEPRFAEAFQRHGIPYARAETRKNDPAELLERLVRTSPRSSSSEGARLIERLQGVARRYDSHETFLESLALRAPEDEARFDLQTVSLLTLHASKGLEFDVVFIAGCEEGLLPYALFPGTPIDVDEERRLLYVAMTRARMRLILTHARRLTGTRGERAPTARYGASS